MNIRQLQEMLQGIDEVCVIGKKFQMEGTVLNFSSKWDLSLGLCVKT